MKTLFIFIKIRREVLRSNSCSRLGRRFEHKEAASSERLVCISTLFYFLGYFFPSLDPLSCAHSHSTHMITVHARSAVCMCTLLAPAHESLYITWWIRLLTHVCISNQAHSYLRTYTIYHFRQIWLYRRTHTLCVFTDVHVCTSAYARLKIGFKMRIVHFPLLLCT